MPTSIENYIFNELPRRLVLDSSIATGSSLTASWVLVATGVGTQAIPVDPATLGFEPEVTQGTTGQYYRGDKTWADLNAAAVGAIAASEKGQPLGVATLDADGFVHLSQMNPAVIERVVVVADEAARYALTTAQVQNGDVVNQQSPAPSSMWYVVDQTNLDNASGYLPFSSGVAASVAWSGITGKPAIIGDLENISLADEGDLLQYVGGAWVNVDIATLKSNLALEISDINLLQDGLDGKQTQSAVLDNVSSINTTGLIVRNSDGLFIGRELVGINGITVTEPRGNADNPTLSLSETGVTAGTYGDEFNYPVVEIDEFGRNISVTTQTITRNPIQIQDVSSTTLQANTEHIFGNGIATYTNSISLELPDNVPGGTWVKIKCGQDFIQATGSVTINAPVGKTVQGDPSFPFSSYFKLYPFSTIDLVYSSPTGNWTILTNATSFLSSLHVARQGATDGVSNSHSIISNATSPRSLSIPDRDVDLSSVGQTDFADNVFTVSDNDDPTKKVAFSVGAISAGETRVVTIPDHNVNLGLVGQTDFLDTAFRVSDNTDPTKKVAIEASSVGTGQVRTITMPNADVDLSKVAQPATAGTDGYFTSDDYYHLTKKVFITSTSTYTVSGNDAQRDHEFILTSNASINIQSLASNKRAVFRSGDGSTYTISNATAASWLFSGISGATVQVSQTQDVYISGNLSSSHVGYITGSRVNTSHFQIAGTGTATFNIPTVGNSVITVPNYNVNLGNIPFLNVSAASPITNGGINHIVIPVGASGVSIPITYGATTSNTKYIVYNNTVSNQPVSLAIAWSGQIAGFSAATYIGYSDQSTTELSNITGISGTYNTPTIVNVPPGGSVELIMYGTGSGATRVNVGITTNTGGLSTYNQWLKIYKSYATADAAKYMWVDGSALTNTRQLTLPDANVDLGNVLPLSAYRYVFREKTGGFTLDSSEVTSTKSAGGNFSTGNVIYNVTSTTDVNIVLSSPSTLGLSIGDSFTIRQADFGIVTVQGTVNGSTTGYHSTFGVGDSFTLIAYSTTAWVRMG